MRPERKFQISIAVFMSLFMSCLMSGTMVLINAPLSALAENGLAIWVEQWVVAWPIACLYSLFLGAPVARIAQRIAGFPQRH